MSKTVSNTQWAELYKVGGVAAFTMIALIPIQMIVFILWPPPSSVTGYFTLFQENWFIGLLSLDLLLMVDYLLLLLIYLALYVALRQFNESLMAIGAMLGVVGIAIYFASNTAFSMLSLSEHYAMATTGAQRSIFLAAGEAMLALYEGTAFDVSYVLGAAALLLISLVMLRSNVFSRFTASMGIVAGVMMIVPPTAGTIGLLLSIVSLVPTAIWLFLIARRFFQLARVEKKDWGKKGEDVKSVPTWSKLPTPNRIARSAKT